MARGAVKTPEQKIAELEAKKAVYQEKIDGYKGKISELDEQIKGIANEKKEAELDKLMRAIAASGKTVEDVLAAIKK